MYTQSYGNTKEGLKFVLADNQLSLIQTPSSFLLSMGISSSPA